MKDSVIAKTLSRAELVSPSDTSDDGDYSGANGGAVDGT